MPKEAVEDLEIVISERPLPDKTRTEALVYVILYNQPGEMVASSGPLTLSYSGDGVSPATKQIQLQADRFKEQVIPDEDEKTLAVQVDSVTGEVSKTLTVSASFDGRVTSDGDFEFGSSLDDDEEDDTGGAE